MQRCPGGPEGAEKGGGSHLSTWDFCVFLGLSVFAWDHLGLLGTILVYLILKIRCLKLGFCLGLGVCLFLLHGTCFV